METGNIIKGMVRRNIAVHGRTLGEGGKKISGYTKTVEQLINEGLIDSEDLRLFPESFTDTVAVVFPSFLDITAFMRKRPQIGDNIWSNVRKAKGVMLLLFKKEDFEKIVKPLLL